MFQLKVLIFELGSVNALASGTIVIGEVTSLAHEAGNYPVETAAFVAKALFVCAQDTEVLGSLWDNISTKLQ